MAVKGWIAQYGTKKSRLIYAADREDAKSNMAKMLQTLYGGDYEQYMRDIKVKEAT